MVEGGFPGEARPLRHHGRNTSRRDHLSRAGESDLGWTATVAGATLRHHDGHRRDEAKVHLVRYADDFIITGTSRILLQREVQPLVEQFLRSGVSNSPTRKPGSRIFENGFDFLGQTVRRYRSGKVLIKPSKRSVKTFLTKIQETIDNSGSMTAGDLILRLNQQIKGWTMYHRYAVSKRTFAAVDNRIFWKLKRWCHRRHPQKSWKWIKTKYFQQVGHRDWVFTGTIRDSTGKGRPIQLMNAVGVKILRWVKIRSAANPYDPEWELYLEERLAWKLSHTLAGRGRIEYLWKEQQGRCVVCGQAASRRRATLAHPPSGLAQSRWPGDVRQPGSVPRQLPPTNPRPEANR